VTFTRCRAAIPRIRVLADICPPAVFHGRATGTDPPCSWVDINTRRAFLRATGFLLDLGHRRIALANGLEYVDFAIRNCTNYVDAPAARGMAADAALMANYELTKQSGYLVAEQMLDRPYPPTAFLAASMLPGIGVRRAIEARGPTFGHNISVIPFDGDLSCLRNGEAAAIFAATRLLVREAGRLAAQMVQDLIAAPDSAPRRHLLKAKLIIGHSPAPLEIFCRPTVDRLCHDMTILKDCGPGARQRLLLPVVSRQLRTGSRLWQAVRPCACRSPHAQPLSKGHVACRCADAAAQTPKGMPMTLVLLADIGGTNTRVALADGAGVRRDSAVSFRNADHPGLEPILAAYLAQQGLASVEGACVAVAGPVQDGVAEMTNLSWVIDAAQLTRATGAGRTAILNDLQAQGHALGHTAPDHLRRVVDGPAKPGASMLVVGLGTGVNAAPVHNTPWGRVVPPSECGHVNMAVRCDEDLQLVRFIESLLASRGDAPHCGVEEVLAGRGLANLYSFAATQAGVAGDLTSAQVFARLEAGDAVAAHAAALYVRILAQTLADLALIHLPYDGIYLIGGMSRAMVPHFARFGLDTGFREMRRVDLLIRDFSITVVEDDYAALTGCAAYLANGGQG